MTDVWTLALEKVAQEFERPNYANNPVQWGNDILGEFYWSKQRDVFDSIRTNRYTAVQSCHDSGKSFIAARVAAWWLSVHPPGSAFIVTTAPTAAQVYAILWREITKAHTKGRLPGRIVTSGYPQWKLDSGELVGYGRKPADYEESAFQGIHALYVLVIMDEAGGIERALYDQVDALATNENARVLAIGNPDDPSSHFRRICQPRSGWATIRIDGLRTPNMTREMVESTRCTQCDSGKPELLMRLMKEEDIPYTTEAIPEPVRPMLLSPLWVEERLHSWVGEPGYDRSGDPESISSKAAASPLFTAKVRGQFPDTSSMGVVPLGWAERAVDRWRDWVQSGKPEEWGRRVIGVDVAREGDDKSVLYVRQGNAPLYLEAFTGKDTMDLADLTASWCTVAHCLAVVDVIGIGAGVVDRLRHLQREEWFVAKEGHPFDVVAFSASERKDIADRTDKSGKFHFRNARSAAWWHLRELLDPSQNGGAKLMLPDDEELIADLTTPRWSVLTGGIIAVEPKDDIKKRIGRSPDKGDACIQAYWVEGHPISTDGYIVGPALPWYPEVEPEKPRREKLREQLVQPDSGFVHPRLPSQVGEDGAFTWDGGDEDMWLT